MTIRRRLLISHLVMFAAPVLMLLITLCTAVAGLFIFIQSGNHVYIESSDQYSRAEEILYHAVFHGKTDEAEIEDASGYRWLVQVLDPEQNYVLLRRADGTTVLSTETAGSGPLSESARSGYPPGNGASGQGRLRPGGK